MIASPLQGRRSKKYLTEDDIPKIRHDFMTVYGFINEDDWDNIPIDTIFTLYPMVQKTLAKAEELRNCSLAFYGAKNTIKD